MDVDDAARLDTSRVSDTRDAAASAAAVAPRSAAAAWGSSDCSTCRFVAIENSLSDYWTSAVQGLQPPSPQLFEQGVTTGCGKASSAVGPFPCQADQGIYLDRGFFDEPQARYGAQGGDFAQAYGPVGEVVRPR